MKNLLLILLLAVSATGYASIPKESQETVHSEVIQKGKFSKASVIFWIDLDKSKDNYGKKSVMSRPKFPSIKEEK